MTTLAKRCQGTIGSGYPNRSILLTACKKKSISLSLFLKNLYFSSYYPLREAHFTAMCLKRDQDSHLAHSLASYGARAASPVSFCFSSLCLVLEKKQGHGKKEKTPEGHGIH